MPTPEPADLYEILQVHPAAHPEVIQAAYRRLAQIYHPDRNPALDASERMAEINAAYAVLNDPQQRAAYDRQRAGAGNSTAGAAAVHDVVKAKSFQLVNDAGQTRGGMSLDADGDPTLFMIDRDGQLRFQIYQTTESGQFGLTINDRQGNSRLWIGESDGGRPMLFMTDRNGNRRFGIYQAESGQEWLMINDRQGYARLWAGEADDGTPMFYMADNAGTLRFAIEQNDNGSPILTFSDRSGKTRVFVGESSDGSPMMFMTDIEGNRRIEIHQDSYGSQELVFYDEDDDIAASIGEDS